jgi:hypothetical protein
MFKYELTVLNNIEVKTTSTGQEIIISLSNGLHHRMELPDVCTEEMLACLLYGLSSKVLNSIPR